LRSDRRYQRRPANIPSTADCPQIKQAPNTHMEGITLPNEDFLHVACSHMLSIKHFRLWRVIAAIYCWMVLITGTPYNICCIFGPWTPALFTWIVLIICTVYMTLAACSTHLFLRYIDGKAFLESEPMHSRCRAFSRCTEVTQAVAPTGGIIVVIAFWTTLYEFANFENPFEFQVHGTVAMVTVIDLYLSCSVMPFKWTFLWTQGLSALYTLFTVVLAFAFDVQLYPSLNWKGDPVGALIFCAMMAVLGLLVHLYLCWSSNKLVARRTTKDVTEATTATASVQISGVV